MLCLFISEINLSKVKFLAKLISNFFECGDRQTQNENITFLAEVLTNRKCQMVKHWLSKKIIKDVNQIDVN